MRTHRLGDIVMARVEDPSGLRINHDHPVIIVTPTSQIKEGGEVRVVVISHNIQKPHPTGHIPMPWSPARHPLTGLWRECVAKCDWTPLVLCANLRDQIGITPKGIMDQIYAELAARIAAKKAAREMTDPSGSQWPEP